MSDIATPLIHVTHDVQALLHHTLPESVIIGRSNAGKSTLINRLMGQTIAKISSVPGKTRTYNLYYKHQQYWVDMPGVGYAQISRTALEQLKNRVRDYFVHRKELSLVIHCMDIRHTWLAWDEALWELYGRKIPTVWVLTKADKLSKQQIAQVLHNTQIYRHGNYIVSGKYMSMGHILSQIKTIQASYRS